MTRRTVATVLNFFVPGPGLWFLNRIRVGTVNLLLAILIPLGVTAFWTSDYMHYVLLAVAAGSAGYAHAAGTRISTQETADADRLPHTASV